jgi:hypothetical protein
VVKDYGADLNGDGVFEGDDGKFKGDPSPPRPITATTAPASTASAFGPAFGRSDGKRYLTVAYGVYGNTGRSDNDHQVLLQYDMADWDRYASPLTEAAPHRNGPATVHGKAFVRTGNTRYGVQNLSYDETQQRWFMGVYQGQKPSFPNYLLFAVEAREQPVRERSRRRAGPGGKGWEQGMLLALADDGLKDAATGVRGWNQKADVGSQPVGQGLFYVSVERQDRRQADRRPDADALDRRRTEAVRPGDCGRCLRGSCLRRTVEPQRPEACVSQLTARQASNRSGAVLSPSTLDRAGRDVQPAHQG